MTSQAERKPSHKRRRLLPLLIAVGLIGLLVAAIAALGGFAPLDLSARAARPSTLILDRNGRLLYEISDPQLGRHTDVPLDDIPLNLQQATIATEDGSFYSNPGVDLWGALRALWINLRGGKVLAGGSTITQQVARTLLMEPEERLQRTAIRKIRENILAYRLARQVSKDEVLRLYLNQVYYGNLAYGVGAAAQAYFGKPVRELDLAECALLAGLPQAPAAYDPLVDPARAKARQEVVLGLMVRQGVLTEAQSRDAAAETLHYAGAATEIRAPHFVMMVRRQLENQFGIERLERGGLRVTTTLDLGLQEAAQAAVGRQLERLNKVDRGEVSHNVHNAGVVALDAATGEILAMVGSPDYFDATIDGAVNATLALRQPGSAIKPVTYATAFSLDYTPATMVVDVRMAFLTREKEPYVPQNYDLTFRGPVLLREALASSYNLVAVKVLEHVGIETMVDTARRLGITTLDDAERFGLALTLGGGEVTLLELTAAYAALAGGGVQLRPMAILRVEDRNGDLVRSYSPVPGPQAVSPQVAYLLTDILSDDGARAPTFGTDSVLALPFPAAVKTGTTTDYRDNWTVGYTPRRVVGVWTGNADNASMRQVSGVTGAAPIWHEVMVAAQSGLPSEPFVEPQGLVHVSVCADSGLLPNADCPNRRIETFVAGTEPTAECTWHRGIRVDIDSGGLATDECPPDRVESRVVMVWPAEALDWAIRSGLYVPPTAACPLHPAGGAGPAAGTGGSSRLVLTSPDPNGVYRISPALPRDAQALELAARSLGGETPASVEFFVDGESVGVATAPPFRVSWRLEVGVHTLQAIGATPGGRRVESDVWRFTVTD